MHVLFASHHFARHSTGGTEVLTAALAAELACRGWRVSWLAEGGESSSPPRDGEAGAVDEWFISPGFGPDHPLDWRADEAKQRTKVEAWLRARPPVDVVHITHFARIGLEFAALDALAHAPLFATLTDYTAICPDFQLYHRPSGAICTPDAPPSLCAGCCGGGVGEIAAWRQRNVDFLNQRAEGIFTMTPHQRMLLERGGIAPAKFVGDRAAYPVPATWEGRVAPARPQGPFRFGVIGRLSPEKGLSVAVAAIAPLHLSEGCTLHVWGVPDGEDPAQLRANAAVVLHDPLPLERLDEAFDAIDCLLVPSLWLENHPLVITYALTLGVRVIVSDVPSLRHLDGDPLLSFAMPGDAASWTREMGRVAAGPSQARNREGIAAQNEAFARHVDLVEALYRQSLRRDVSSFIIGDDLDRYGIVPGRASASPGFLQVELTDRCNLACTSCPRATVPSSEDILGLDVFTRMLDAAPGLEHVSFVGGGEALFVKDFDRYVRLCTERGIRTSTVTNGLLVPLRAGAAVEAGLSRLGISVDSADDAELRAIRGGMTLSALERSVRAAIELTRGTATALFAATTLSARNVAGFANVVALVARLGVRELSVEGLHHWGDDRSLDALTLLTLDPALVIEHIERGLTAAQRAGVRVSIFDYTRLADPPRFRDAHCPWPWDAAFVTSRGEVTPCCVHLTASETNVLGRIGETSFDRIWSGEKYGRFRESFQTPGEWESCQGCVYRMEFGKAVQ